MQLTGHIIVGQNLEGPHLPGSVVEYSCSDTNINVGYSM